MLHYDRRPVAEKRQAKNFLAINKNSVKNKSNRAKQKDEESEQRKLPLQGRQKEKQRNGPPPTNNTKQKDNNEETVTISKDYLDKLIGALQSNTQSSGPLPPVVSVTDHSSVRPPLPQPTDSPRRHVIIDHNKIPGLEEQDPYQSKYNTATYNTHVPLPTNTSSSYSSDINTSLLANMDSPRGGETYHRGTTNRPVHPAMKSQIVFGAGPGWGTDNQQREREEAKLRWMNELAEQIKDQNSHVIRNPVSVREKDRIPLSSIQDLPQIEQMKAENVHNPASVTGRGGTAQISVGLQLQRSPKEQSEKKLKELEHREYLLAQIEDKRRKKEQEKMILDKEAKDEERRLAEERGRMAREFEIEKQMQQRKRIEEARKIAILEERIKLAEQSAFQAKQEMKNSRRVASDKHDSHVTFQHQSRDRIDPTISGAHRVSYTDDRNIEPVMTSIDLRSPSLHTIPISQSDKSIVSPRTVKNSYDRQGNRPKASYKSGATTVISTNSQVSLYSSSSEEPLNAIRKKTRFKPEHPTSGKKLGPSGTRENRIPRKTILRRQLGKNIRDKSESESEERDPTIRRTVTNHSQQPNSIAKSKNRNISHTERHNRPSSTESQDGASRHQLINSRSLPSQSRNIENPITQPRIVSPPVPAVARRLAEEEQSRKGTNTSTVPTIKNEEIDNQLHVNNHHKKNANRPRSARIRRNESVNHTSQNVTNESTSNAGFKLPEIVLSSSTCTNPSSNVSTNISSQPLPALSNNPTQQVHVAAIPLSCAPTNVPNLPPISNNPSSTVPPLSKTSNATSHMYSFVRTPSYPPDNQSFSNNTIANNQKCNQNVSCTLTPIMEELPSREEPRESIPSRNGVYRLNSRQRSLILANLAKLKEGIIIQSQNVNSRVSSVLSRKHFQ